MSPGLFFFLIVAFAMHGLLWYQKNRLVCSVSVKSAIGCFIVSADCSG